MGFGKFFHAGLVDEIVLDCYRLSKHYGLDPDVFLQKPLSVIKRHMHWTAKLERELQQSQEENAF